MRLLKSCLIIAIATLVASNYSDAQATVHVEQENLKGPRELQEQTKTAIIRDYVQAWQGLNSALDQNRADLLGADFVGVAKDKLTETIEEQSKQGFHTRYKDVSHDLQIVFYSPEGLSIELTDKVEYEVQVLDHDKVTATQRVNARYVVVMTPAEVRWRVRVFQAVPE